ncbi:MAG: ATP-dependent metallopeptidase FtsH/Yme1/Tma family protein, partial [Pirellulaceae bacterium]
MAADKKPAETPPRPKEPRPGEPRTSLSVTWIVVILLAVSTLWIAQRYSENWTEIDYSFFHEQVLADNVRSLKLEGQTAYGEFREPPPAPVPADAAEKPGQTDAATEPKRLAKKFRVTLLSPLVDDELRKFWMSHNVQLQAQQPTDYSDLLAMIWLIALVILALGLWNFFRRTRDQVFGGGMLSGVTRSRASRYEPNFEGITFYDVAGLDTVKKDLQE